MANDIIIAPATPVGKSAIAVVRLSGKGCIELVKKRISLSAEGLSCDFPVEHRKAVYGFLYDGRQEIIDEVMVLFLFGPRSYTREDMVEIYCHGNWMIVERIIEEFLDMGVRYAERGEFTYRAFLNGRIDLIQAQGVLSLIEANDVWELSVAQRQLQGEVSLGLKDIYDGILSVLVEMEAELEFPDDVGCVDRSKVCQRLSKVEDTLGEFIESSRRSSQIWGGVKVVLGGMANVGKSSLFNRIVRRERSIVYDMPGTTRDVVDVSLRKEGVAIRLFDTAGVIEVADGVDKIAVEKTKQVFREAHIIVWVFDVREKIDDDIRYVREFISLGKDVVVFGNKADLIEGQADFEFLKESFGCEVLIGSVRWDDTISKIEEKIFSLAKKIEMKIDKGMILSVWQIKAMEELKDRLRLVKKQMSYQEKEEIIVQQLKEMLSILDKILGRDFDIEMIDRIFSQFCIGK